MTPTLSTAMSGLLTAAAVMLLLAALMTLLRIYHGPSNLDRALATDVLVVLVTSSAAIFIAWTGDAASLPILVVVALTGFVGSVSVARFMARSKESRR